MLRALSASKKFIKLVIVVSIFLGVVLIPRYLSVETLATVLSVCLIIFAAVAIYDLVHTKSTRTKRDKI